MKLGSLFDGSGTCPLAASVVGIIPAWASEIEPFPMAVTQSRFPKMKHLGDITKMDGGKIEPVDVITFGSPCQNLSIAGNRTVLETLWQICEGDDSVPRYEEDRSGRQKWPKRGFIVGDHSSIAWRGLDAQFWGVAQRRKRVFLVLDLGGQCAGQILFERDGLQRDFEKVRRTGKAVRPSPETSSAEHHRVYAVENHSADSRVSIRQDDIFTTLTSRMGTGGG